MTNNEIKTLTTAKNIYLNAIKTPGQCNLADKLGSLLNAYDMDITSPYFTYKSKKHVISAIKRVLKQ